jgi:hypothetical protein
MITNDDDLAMGMSGMDDLDDSDVDPSKAEWPRIDWLTLIAWIFLGTVVIGFLVMTIFLAWTKPLVAFTVLAISALGFLVLSIVRVTEHWSIWKD